VNTTEFEEALAELLAAQQHHEETAQAARVASSNAVSACNRLNIAQKKIDELIAALKKSSPNGSDWARNKGGHHG